MTEEGRRVDRRPAMTGEGRKAVRPKETRVAIRLKVAEVVAVGRRAAETAETADMAAETAAETAAEMAAAVAAHRTNTADRNHAADKYQKVTKKAAATGQCLIHIPGFRQVVSEPPPAEPEQNGVISSRQLNRSIR
jgi:hypothetical protein